MREIRRTKRKTAGNTQRIKMVYTQAHAGAHTSYFSWWIFIENIHTISALFIFVVIFHLSFHFIFSFASTFQCTALFPCVFAVLLFVRCATFRTYIKKNRRQTHSKRALRSHSSHQMSKMKHNNSQFTTPNSQQQTTAIIVTIIIKKKKKNKQQRDVIDLNS